MSGRSAPIPPQSSMPSRNACSFPFRSNRRVNSSRKGVTVSSFPASNTPFGTDPDWNAAQDEQVGQYIDDVGARRLAPDPNRQTLAAELAENVEHVYGPAAIGQVMDEDGGPGMVHPLGARPDTGSVVQPETTSLRLSGWRTQPLPPPQALDRLVIDPPADISQQGGDPPARDYRRRSLRRRNDL